MTVAPTSMRARAAVGLRARAASRDAAWTAAASILLGVGLAVNALLGPLLADVIDYRVTETLLNQTLGLEAVSLAVVAPLAIVGGLLILRGHRAGAPLVVAVGAFTAYMFVQYVLGPDYLRLAGNNELYFPLYLALFALGWIVALRGWWALDGELPGSRRRDRLIGGIVLPLLAFAAFIRYLPALGDAMSDAPGDAGYLGGPTFFWAIALMDLGIFLPATIATCTGLLRGAPWARKMLYALLGWFALVGPAVAGMAVAMYVNDDPAASGGSTVFVTLLGGLFAVLAAFLYRPLFRKGRGRAREC